MLYYDYHQQYQRHVVLEWLLMAAAVVFQCLMIIFENLEVSCTPSCQTEAAAGHLLVQVRVVVPTEDGG